MRIALVHYSAPPVIGGVETIVAGHARLLRAAGHEVRIVAKSGAPDIAIAGARDLPAALEGCDCVLVHNVLTMPFDMELTLALRDLAAIRRDTRWIAWVHDMAAINADYQPSAPVLAEPSPHFEYVTVSPMRARQFRDLTGVESTIVPNGVDPAQQLGLPEAVVRFADRHALLAREIVLLHPTRLLRRKNVEFGIETAAALRALGHDAVLVVTGAPDPHNAASADYARQLRELRRAKGVEDCVIFAGEEIDTGPDAVAHLYRVADALFFPSHQEGFGLPVIEAALHRLPIFCSDIEPLNALLHEPIHRFPPAAPASDVAREIVRGLRSSSRHRTRKEALTLYAWQNVWEKSLRPLIEGGGPSPRG